MKNRLLTTTALVAAGLLTAPAAQAEDPIQLSVGGFMEQYFGYGASDIDDRDHFDQKSDSEIIFSGSTTLDNGIQFGVNVQLEGNSSSDQIDESFAFIEGDFGRILMGSENTAGYIMTVFAPNVGIGINTGDQADWVPISSDAGFTRAPLGATQVENAGVNDANRLTYFTPSFSGFQGGISYTPDASEDSNTQPSENAEYHDGIDAAVKFRKVVSDIDIRAYGRYGIASNDSVGGDDPSVFSTGMSLGYAGITVGGSYANQDEAGVNEGQSFDLGVSYETGPWGVSATYFQGEAEGDVAVGGDEEVSTLELAASYALGPGIKVIGSVGYNDFDDDDTGADDDSNDGYWVVSGIQLSF